MTSIFDIIKRAKEKNNLENLPILQKSQPKPKEDEINSDDFIPFVSFESNTVNADDVVDSISIPPWIPDSLRPNGRLYPSNNPLCRLHEELIDFVKYISLTEEEVRIRTDLINTINDTSLKIWPESKLSVFGSFKTNTSLPDSDIDIMISNVPVDKKDVTLHMNKLKDELNKISFFDFVDVISKATVPIIKLRSKDSHIWIDISFNEESAESSCKLSITLLETYPSLRCLYMTIKYLIRQRDLNVTFRGGLGSYLLLSMCICAIQNVIKEKKDSLNLGICFLEFFAIFGHGLCYREVGVSISKGGSFFKKYDEDFYENEKDSFLCFENINDTDMDIGNNAWATNKWKPCIRNGFELLIRLCIENDSRKTILGYLIYQNDTLLNRKQHVRIDRLDDSLFTKFDNVKTENNNNSSSNKNQNKNTPQIRRNNNRNGNNNNNNNNVSNKTKSPIPTTPSSLPFNKLKISENRKSKSKSKSPQISTPTPPPPYSAHTSNPSTPAATNTSSSFAAGKKTPRTSASNTNSVSKNNKRNDNKYKMNKSVPFSHDDFEEEDNMNDNSNYNNNNNNKRNRTYSNSSKRSNQSHYNHKKSRK